MIDFVCIRRATVDSVAKKASAVDAPMAGWRQGGHKPVLVRLKLDWRPWRMPKQPEQHAPQRKTDAASGALRELKLEV